MRMSGEGASAADVVNAASERDLANIIFTLGEERHSRAIARAIVKARIIAPIATTHELAQIVATIVRPRAGDIHPATRTFQALRIFVNDELGELVAALQAAERILKPGGRLVVVSFHSLEDRIVKTFLADRGDTRGGSRHAPEVQAPRADLPGSHQASGDRRTTMKSRVTRARDRPSCAPPSGPMRRRGAACRRVCCRICPRWPPC